MQQPLNKDGLAAETLIDGILVRRVLDHVRDPRVRALTDPGLVVRRITADVIKNVMTRGTSRPQPGAREERDEERDEPPAEPWEVNGDEAKSIFEAFENQVDLMETDRGALRHRPDVRKDMLPLIRARRPKQFEAMNRLAYDYFRGLSEKDPGDLASASEALYHGLWLDEPLERLNELWRSLPTFDPRIDHEEFDKRSRASIFLRAKSGTALTPSEIEELPGDVALEWLDAQRQAPGLPQDRGRDPGDSPAAGENFERLESRPSTAAVLARLMFRAGLWDESERLARSHLDRATEAELAGPTGDEPGEPGSRAASTLSLLRTWTTIVAKGHGPASDLERASYSLRSVLDPLSRAEIAAHTLIGFARQGGGPTDHRNVLKTIITGAAGAIRPTIWRREQRVLRLVASAGLRWPDLLATWIESREQAPRSVEPAVQREVLLQIDLGRSSRKQLEESGSRSVPRNRQLEVLDRVWIREKPAILEAARDRSDLTPRFWMMVTRDRYDWKRPLGNALTRALKQESLGDSVIERLDRAGLLGETITPRRRRDGLAITEATADEGRLVELAAPLASLKGELIEMRRLSRQEPAYPQDAFCISEALLGWDSTIADGERLGLRIADPQADRSM